MGLKCSLKMEYLNSDLSSSTSSATLGMVSQFNLKHSNNYTVGFNFILSQWDFNLHFSHN